MDIDYFLKINNSYGVSNRKETKLYEVKKHINDRFSDTINCYSVLYENSPRDVLITKTQKMNQKTITGRPDETFEIGGYIDFDNNTWMIIEKDELEQIYPRGKMQLCNYVLKFQHPLTKEILSYPCIDDSSSLSAGVEVSNVTSDGNATKTLRLPYDINTVLINTDDRFIIDDSIIDVPQVYKITKPNRTSLRRGIKGMIELTLKQDKFDSNTDNKDMGVCNYESPLVVEPANQGYSEIVSTDDEFAIYVGSYIELIAKFFNGEGERIEGITPQWEVSSTTISSNDYIVSINNDILKIQTKQSYSNVGKYLEVKLKNSNYESNIQLKIVM